MTTPKWGFGYTTKRMTQPVYISQRHILKLDTKEFPDGLDVEYEREESRMTLKF